MNIKIKLFNIAQRSAITDNNLLSYISQELKVQNKSGLSFPYLKKPTLTPTTLLYTKGLMSHAIMIKYYQHIYIYQVKNNIMRINLDLHTNYELHNYETRQRNYIFISTGSNSVLYTASKEYNNFPIEIRNLTTHMIKRNLK